MSSTHTAAPLKIAAVSDSTSSISAPLTSTPSTSTPVNSTPLSAMPMNQSWTSTNDDVHFNPAVSSTRSNILVLSSEPFAGERPSPVPAYSSEGSGSTTFKRPRGRPLGTNTKRKLSPPIIAETPQAGPGPSSLGVQHVLPAALLHESLQISTIHHANTSSSVDPTSRKSNSGDSPNPEDSKKRSSNIIIPSTGSLLVKAPSSLVNSGSDVSASTVTKRTRRPYKKRPKYGPLITAQAAKAGPGPSSLAGRPTFSAGPDSEHQPEPIFPQGNNPASHNPEPTVSQELRESAVRFSTSVRQKFANQPGFSGPPLKCEVCQQGFPTRPFKKGGRKCEYCRWKLPQKMIKQAEREAEIAVSMAFLRALDKASRISEPGSRPSPAVAAERISPTPIAQSVNHAGPSQSETNNSWGSGPRLSSSAKFITLNSHPSRPFSSTGKGVDMSTDAPPAKRPRLQLDFTLNVPPPSIKHAVGISTPESAADLSQLQVTAASKTMDWSNVASRQGEMPPAPAPSMIPSPPSSQRSDLRSGGSFGNMLDRMDVDMPPLSSRTSDQMRPSPAANGVENQSARTLATAALRPDVQPQGTASGTVSRRNVHPPTPSSVPTSHHQNQPTASTVTAPVPWVWRPLPLPALPVYCCDPRDMALPALYYQYEPGRATEWFKTTFITCDVGTTIIQSAIWREYLGVFQHSPAPLLTPRDLFLVMCGLFPHSAVGLAKEDNSYRVFGAGRVDMRSPKLFHLKDLYEGRMMSSGEKRYIRRAEHETGFTLAPSVQPGGNRIPMTAGPSQSIVASTPNNARKTAADVTSELAKAIAAEPELTARQKETKEFRREWKFLDHVAWPPNLRMTNPEEQKNTSASRPTARLEKTPYSIHPPLSHPPYPVPARLQRQQPSLPASSSHSSTARKRLNGDQSKQSLFTPLKVVEGLPTWKPPTDMPHESSDVSLDGVDAGSASTWSWTDSRECESMTL